MIFKNGLSPLRGLVFLVDIKNMTSYITTQCAKVIALLRVNVCKYVERTPIVSWVVTVACCLWLGVGLDYRVVLLVVHPYLY